MRAGQAVDFASRLLINSLSAATSGTLNFLFMLGVMLYAMYFFLEGGGRLVDRILFYLPLDDAEERLLLDRFRSVARATLKGTAVIGLLQGTLAGIAFAVAGVPSAAFWGALMVALSVVPGIGIGLVWVPASIVLVAGGHTLEGVLLALFCGGVVGSIDNVLRPRLVGKDTKLPDLLILLSTIGGISMFGMLGLIVGPILAALFVTVWEIYGRVFADVLPAGGPDGGPPDEPA
jgi:predicted PurR-regulated permease PerM